jgi:predicted ATPase
VEWSWELLEDSEQALWRRLSIFAGGATVEAAEAVCAQEGLPRAEVLDVLTALVDKSLAHPAGEREPRYRMLETIRAYGLERLAEAGEEEWKTARSPRRSRSSTTMIRGCVPSPA